MVEKAEKRGRPKVDDMKIKFDNIRLKTSTILDIEVVATQLNITPSIFVRTVLENEIGKYKELVSKKGQ